MRIGIYTLFLTPGQIGGIETYLRHLVTQLGKIDRNNRYTLFVSEHNRHIFNEISYPNFRKETISLIPTRSSLVDRIFRKLKIVPSHIARQLNVYPVELLHYPGTTIDQPEIKTPCILTMHDLQHEYFPGFFSQEELAWRNRWFLPSAKKARHIITVSEFTRQTIIEKYDIMPQKITAIYHGISPIFKAVCNKKMIVSIRQKYGLPDQFVFFPANPWPHKNHARLFDAVNLLRQDYHTTVQLVLSGVWADKSGLSRLIARAGLANQVHLLGYLPYKELPALYTAASALVFPSLFEGFGLPALEAMACGCPVICSNTTSLPELVGDAAILIDPVDVAQIAEAIYNVLHDQSLRKSLVEKGLLQAKRFTWKNAARQTVAVYENAL